MCLLVETSFQCHHSIHQFALHIINIFVFVKNYMELLLLANKRENLLLFESASREKGFLFESVGREK